MKTNVKLILEDSGGIRQEAHDDKPADMTNKGTGRTEWYAVFYARHGLKPSTPHRSIAAAEAAIAQWAARIPESSDDNPTSRMQAGKMTITGPYPTKKQAMIPDINDERVRRYWW